MSSESGSSEPIAPWNYDEAFSRHRGLICPVEQQLLRESRVAIAGLGGVGGIHLVTLARLGIGGFHLADPDDFELVNFNRQYGATTRSLGCSKVEVMAAEARTINPELDLKLFNGPVTSENIAAFLDGVDVVVDGLDFSALEARRLLFREARKRRIWALTAGPIGFSAAWLVFDPLGMSFDEYFDLKDTMEPLDKLAAFLMGLTPRALQRSYMDLSQADLERGRGPSAGLACQLCAGVAAAEVLKILLKREPVRPAPQSFQFDPYRQRLATTHLPRGNGTPWRRWLRGRLRGHLERQLLRRPKQAPPAETALEQLLAAAVLAPSGDNTQPWHFVVKMAEGKIAVTLDEEKDPSPMNAGQRMARIAVGAAVENILHTANSNGWTVELEDVSPAQAVLRLHAPFSAPGRPAPAVVERVSNRRFYDRRPVASDVLQHLAQATAPLDGVTTHWICDRDRIVALAELVGRADALMFGEPSIRRAFLSKVRFDAPYEAEVKEGLSLASLELSLPERLGMRLMPWMPNSLLHFSGAMRALGVRAQKLVESASGLCLVVAPNQREETDVFVGRAMQRAWLTLTAQGLAVQPMMSLLVLENVAEHGTFEVHDNLRRKRASEVVKDFHSLTPERGAGRAAFLMRFGFAAPPSGRTGRLPPSVTVINGALQPIDEGP